MTRFELERAIAENELLLHYQPIVGVPDRNLSGVEALVRWKHPERGIVSPMEFIPEAEATGLIRQLTFWVLREALLQSNVWRRDQAPLTVAVNLSVENLRDTHFARFLELTLKVAGGPELLVAETSARALLRAGDPPIGTMQLMRERGIRVAIDDVDDDETQLTTEMPADIVKVGRGLIGRMAREAAALDTVRALIHATRQRGLAITAVGVEDEATWNLCGDLELDAAQGYYIAPPMPAAELSAWRRQRV